ncbi:Protein of unknown function [Catalinimonas alkaloidigena]|uniref:DUF2891 domain-containing protein n=1 Tax=Catalinimonas alkaloidigena TaxID=1075417 RepID=A0A1G9LRS9_9BACT|nr:DUF2891 domain-containing protein [Catalinimonas alkaloidigena]SDL64175.1 Protein of unknown function [Catalinimonas alkaloidigena]
MKKLFLLLSLTLSCQSVDHEKPATASETTQPAEAPPVDLTLAEANRLVALPLKCMQNEFPNKPSETLESEADLQPPSVVHPAFYGCFDWHSSVHGHWMLVHLLKQFPNLDRAEEIREKLQANLSADNIQQELVYFTKDVNKSYERTYGWAWLLKLEEELKRWEEPWAQQLAKNLQPLADLLVVRYLDFLPKLNYPIRVGEHTNTAFGLTFAWDYAEATGQTALQELIAQRAKDFYGADAGCPLNWEPSGYDFLSPCLEEADLMRRVLPEAEFQTWLGQFLPQLSDPNFTLEPGKVSDRTDGKLVHLDGLNFSRAWCLLGIAQTLPDYAHLKPIAYEHIRHSLPNIVDGAYEGEHWLASFAIYALSTAEQNQPSS